MNFWFECKVKYRKASESSADKMVSESYLVEALSFTEAEARITEKITPYSSGDFTVDNIKRVRFAEFFFNETGDRYYRAKLFFLHLDEKSGTEKQVAVAMLVQAMELKEAVQIICDEMSKTMIDYKIAGISETALLDAFFIND